MNSTRVQPQRRQGSLPQFVSHISLYCQPQYPGLLTFCVVYFCWHRSQSNVTETSRNTFSDRLARTIQSVWPPRTSATLAQRQHRHQQYLWHRLRWWWHHQHYRMAHPTPHRPMCQRSVKSTLPCQVGRPSQALVYRR